MRIAAILVIVMCQSLANERLQECLLLSTNFLNIKKVTQVTLLLYLFDLQIDILVYLFCKVTLTYTIVRLDVKVLIIRCLY